jgi:uncharacterized protein YbjT (DUF2867 family)
LRDAKERMSERRLFIAGSTGAVGRTVFRLCAADAVDAVAHMRPNRNREQPTPPNAAVFELSDASALDAALSGCTTGLQLIGTMRKRFATGDTYESSDIGTTRHLVESAKRTGIDHFVLLSSAGAGRPIGAYLQAKAKAEALVRDSGVPYTLVRPSAFEGEGHRPIPGLGLVTRALGLDGLRPIPVETLARLLIQVARERRPLGAVLEGRGLWGEIESGVTRSP